jgi:hypothetical protein
VNRNIIEEIIRIDAFFLFPSLLFFFGVEILGEFVFGFMGEEFFVDFHTLRKDINYEFTFEASISEFGIIIVVLVM